MDRKTLEMKLFKSDYLEIAFKHFLDFKNTSTYDETYKFDILSDLNSYLQELTITKENIVEIVNKIKSSNPQAGSFVHWSNTSDLSDYAKAQPKEAADLLQNLYKNDDLSIQKKIEQFQSAGKQWKSSVSLGAPLFGYLLAAIDYKKYPLYKEGVFQYVKKMLGINKKLSSVDENYQDFYDVCVVTLNYMAVKGYSLNMLDIQDFFFCLSQYDKLKVESAVEYLHAIAKKLSYFKQNDEAFIEKIKEIDRSELEHKREAYRNANKVNRIRFLIIDFYLKEGKLTKTIVERIKEEVNNQNETNILQAWTNFTILFQIYYDSIKYKVKFELFNIHKAIRNMEGAAKLDLELDDTIKGFNWKQNFGDTECWLAVYPAKKQSHKLAAQLFLSIDEKGIRFGLGHGSDNTWNGTDDIDTISLEEFTYQKMAEKFNDVLQLFTELNQLNKKDNARELSQTFSSIFNTIDEANWAFNFANQTLKKLGVTESGDERVAVTIRSDHKLHFNFCSWLVLGFTKDKDGRIQVSLTLIENEISVSDASYTIEPFAIKENKKPIVLVNLPLKEFQSSRKLQTIHDDTLDIIKDRFTGYAKSPYRRFHQDKLDQAIFSQEERNELFAEEVPLSPGDYEERETNYFWLTAKPAIWSVENIKNGRAVNYTAYNEKGNKRRIYTAFESAQPGDKILFYESTPRKEIIGQGEIVEGLHIMEDEKFGGAVEAVAFRYVEDMEPISWETLAEVEEIKDSKPIKNGAQGSLFELTKAEYETILSLEPTQMENNKMEIPTVSFQHELNMNGLYFEEKDHLLRQIKTALRNNKHIILTGPPGTGKSKLAKEVCKSFEADYKMATATSDWSTYETIGGYKPKSDGTLSFNPGLFLDCFKDLDTNRPANKWLIIDEMNRADIDKAFGSLFSALTGDAITLNFQSESGQSLILRPQHTDQEVTLNDYEYIIPNDWRLIGTMNTLDKASLYEMSYAFMRRFAFIPVGVPRQINIELINALLDKWQIKDYPYAGDLAFIWQLINQYRQIGPAIVEDIAKYTLMDPDFTSAIILYVLPQFEGLLDQDILAFIAQLSELSVIETVRLKQFAQDFFHIKE